MMTREKKEKNVNLCDLDTLDNKLSIDEYKIVKDIADNYNKIFVEERTNHIFIYTLDNMEELKK